MDDEQPPPERRHRQPGRRVADAVATSGAIAYEVIDDDVREIAVALTRIQRGWKRWVAIAAAIGGIVSATVGVMVWLGWSQISPDERFRQHDQTMNARITGLETRTENLEDAVDLVSYLLCVQIRRTDPAAVPPRCNDLSIRRLAPR